MIRPHTESESLRVEDEKWAMMYYVLEFIEESQ